MKRAALLLILVLAVTLWIGCMGQEKGDLESTPTASIAGQEVTGAPVGTVPPGRLVVNVTFSEPPLVNRTVTATVGVYNPTQSSIDNTQIVLILYRKRSPYTEVYDPVPLWQAILWNGTLPGNGHVMASTPFRVEGPGYYYARGMAFDVAHRGYNSESGVVFVRLNVYENQTIVLPGIGPSEPEPPSPPTIPYVIKMDLDGVPALNRPVNLRVTIASLMDQKNATFRIFLPEGFELVSGDLVWHGDLQKAMDATEISASRENLLQGKIAEATLQRITEDKKVRMQATIRATRWGDALIFVFPSLERPSGIDCTLQGLNIPHPLIGKEVSGGWLAVSYGGCLNVRVLNETDAIFSEQQLPLYPLAPKPPVSPNPPPPMTPPPGMMWQNP